MISAPLRQVVVTSAMLAFLLRSGGSRFPAVSAAAFQTTTTVTTTTTATALATKKTTRFVGVAVVGPQQRQGQPAAITANAASKLFSTKTTASNNNNKQAEEGTESSVTTTTTATTPDHVDVSLFTMDDVIGLCKRRGLIFASSDIYNGYAGFYDYGPVGVELKRAVKEHWWRTFVTGREDVVGLDSSIIHNPLTWKFSGHVDGFSDPMVDCKVTKLRYRADQLYYAEIRRATISDGNNNHHEDVILGYVCVQEGNDADMVAAATKQAKAILKAKAAAAAANDTPNDGSSSSTGGGSNSNVPLLEPFQFIELTEADEATMALIPSPSSDKPGSLTMPRDFNLMFQTQVGAVSDASSTAYLRPETAQGIFLNFKNVLTTSRQKIPFGIAQTGKAFRNEITPRNFIFRSREFEQMEVEYFIPPGGSDVWSVFHNQWIADSEAFLLSTGLRPELLGRDVHSGDKLAHYAVACTDITFRFPFGTQELMGIAARGNYDLTQHAAGSGKNLDYYDEETKEKYIPHCIEPSLGVDRLILALICSAYAEDEIGGEKRSLLKFDPKIAPIKVAILPLVKNKEALVSVARELFDKLRVRWNCQWDAAGAIGRRYRRADEVGVPFCITVDFDTIEKDNAVTIRDRDTTDQIRLPIDEVIPYLSKAIDGY